MVNGRTQVFSIHHLPFTLISSIQFPDREIEESGERDPEQVRPDEPRGGRRDAPEREHRREDGGPEKKDFDEREAGLPPAEEDN